MANSGEKWQKVPVMKSGEKWEKVGKSWKKVAKSWKKWGIVGISGENWQKVGKIGHFGFRFVKIDRDLPL